jgi:hypothetical protein
MNAASMKWPVTVLIVTLTSSVAAPVFAQSASADEKADVLECAKSFEQAQILRNDAKYVSATEEALKCSQPKCGQALQTECSRLYTELQQAAPSVVLSASDQNGNEIGEAQVVVDQTRHLEHLDGKPITLDPGNHEFAFTAPGLSALTRRITLLAGEKFRPISVTLGAGSAGKQPKPAEPLPASKTDRPSLAPRHIPTLSYVLGGVSLLAAAGFVAFRASGANKYDSLMQTCSPNCAESDVDNVRQRYNVSYVALGVSAATLVGAVGFYFLQTRTPLGVDSALSVQPAPHGAGAQIVTHF